MNRRLPLHSLVRPKQQVFSAIELLYVRDASVMLGCSEKAVRRKVERHLIPYRHLAGRVCFLRSELEEFISTLPGVGLAEAQANLRLRSGEEMRR